MKKVVKVLLVVVVATLISATSFIAGMYYTTNNTSVTVGERGEVNVCVKDQNVSQRELTPVEVEFIEANNEYEQVVEKELTQRLVPSVSIDEIRQQKIEQSKKEELTQRLVPASVTITK